MKACDISRHTLLPGALYLQEYQGLPTTKKKHSSYCFMQLNTKSVILHSWSQTPSFTSPSRTLCVWKKEVFSVCDRPLACLMTELEVSHVKMSREASVSAMQSSGPRLTIQSCAASFLQVVGRGQGSIWTHLSGGAHSGLVT